jgi:hypothetical protein
MMDLVGIHGVMGVVEMAADGTGLCSRQTDGCVSPVVQGN